MHQHIWKAKNEMPRNIASQISDKGRYVIMSTCHFGLKVDESVDRCTK